MGFPVPWRFLVPADGVEEVFCEAGKRQAEESGAVVKISSEDEAPATLSDKIVTLEGAPRQKEDACRHILRELWTSQGIPPEEDGVFVLVLPSSAIGAVIGTKGAKIREIMEASGTSIDVGKEPIIGMPDIPAVITGLQDQVLAATAMAHAVLQDLVDRDRLRADDFVYVPGRGATAAPRTPRGAAGQHSARFVVSRGAAGFLIGKGGQKVRELREESGGATIQLRDAQEEPALGLGDDERILEVRGEAAQRDRGVRAVLAAMEQMPEPPRDVRLLVPVDTERARLEEAAGAASARLDLVAVAPRPGHGPPREAIVSFAGGLAARASAVLAALGAAPAAAGAAAEAAAPPAAAPAAAAAAAPPRSAAGVLSQAEEDRRVEPEGGVEYNFEEFRTAFAGTYTDAEIRDYWRDACKPARPSEGPPEGDRAEAERPVPPAEPRPGLASAARAESGAPPLAGSPQSEPWPAARPASPAEPRPRPAPAARAEPGTPLGPALLQQQPPPLAQQQQPPPRLWSALPSGPCWGAPGPPQEAPALGALLPAGGPLSRLQLLVPSAPVRGPLAAQGHLAGIAQGCRVQIDLCEEVSPGLLRLQISGAAVANSLAAVCLQWHLWFGQAAL